MGIVAGLAGAAAATSLASTAAGFFGDDSSGGRSPNGTYGGNPATYIPTAQPQADSMYQGIYSNMNQYASALPGQLIPGYQTYAGNIQSNPYAGQAQAGANRVGTVGQNVGDAQIAAAGNMNNAGNQVMTTAFDPQSALYNQLQNQTMQQANVANAQSGVSGPYAAGVTGQALQNFNIGWQNQQLARQTQGEQAAGQAYAGASGLGTAGLSTYGSSSAAPYNTYMGQQQNNLGALSSISGGVNAAFGPEQSVANMLQSYLKLGQSATGLAQSGQQQGFSQNQQLGSQFGQSLQALGGPLQSLFSGGGGGDSYVPSMYMGTGGGYAPSYDYGGYSGVDPAAFAGAGL